MIFQSTHPSWGATIYGAYRSPLRSKFQSTHPSWGATAQVRTGLKSMLYFNPRTHRGVRRQSERVIAHSFYYFNPRTHRGVRQQEALEQTKGFEFQSTHPSWGATILTSLA